MFLIDVEGKASRLVPRSDVEWGRKKDIESSSGASGLSVWRMELSGTAGGPVCWLQQKRKSERSEGDSIRGGFSVRTQMPAVMF